MIPLAEKVSFAIVHWTLDSDCKHTFYMLKKWEVSQKLPVEISTC